MKRSDGSVHLDFWAATEGVLQNIPIKTFAYLNLWSLCSQREGSRQLCTLLAQCCDRWGEIKSGISRRGPPIKRYQLKHSLQVVSQHSLGKLRPNLSVTNNQTNDRKVETQSHPTQSSKPYCCFPALPVSNFWVIKTTSKGKAENKVRFRRIKN